MNVYSSPDLAMVGHLKNILETHGIDCYIHGEIRGSLAGSLPPIQCWPELWVKDESQAEQAKQIVSDTLDTNESGRSDWNCPKCHEHLKGQFTLCWKCGTDRPDIQSI